MKSKNTSGNLALTALTRALFGDRVLQPIYALDEAQLAAAVVTRFKSFN